MTECRQSALAMMKIHRERVKELDLEYLTPVFANVHQRKMFQSNFLLTN